jgi:hypothetical protein
LPVLERLVDALDRRVRHAGRVESPLQISGAKFADRIVNKGREFCAVVDSVGISAKPRILSPFDWPRTRANTANSLSLPTAIMMNPSIVAYTLEGTTWATSEPWRFGTFEDAW